MELIENAGPELVKKYVEVVPDKLYWAAVDLEPFIAFVRTSNNACVMKPLRKENVKIKSLQKPGEDSKLAATDDIEQTEPAAKVRRSSSSTKIRVKESPRVKVLYTDRVFKYQPLANDFGPLDLPTTLRYIDFVDSKRVGEKLPAVIIHVSDIRSPKLCANSAYLVSIYALSRLGMSSGQIWSAFESVPSSILPPFRDASSAVTCSFPITIKDCLEGFELGLKHRWMDWDKVDVAETEILQTVEHGDMNWIIQDKFLAFAGPSSTCADEDGLEVLPVSFYVPLFKKFSVTDIVRLNVANYHHSEFTDHGFTHHDLFFEDGSCPPMRIVHAFLKAAEEASGALAVHCKAGLGRTVTLIGAHVIQKYKVSAKTFIAWARIARPGSVLGPQQHFLVELQTQLLSPNPVIAPRKVSGGSVPHRFHGSESIIGRLGEAGQARVLLHQKRARPTSPVDPSVVVV